MLAPVILKNPPMDSRLSQKAMPCLVNTTHETRQNLGAQAMHLRTRIRTHSVIHFCSVGGHAPVVMPYQNSGKILKMKLSLWIGNPNFEANAPQL